MSILRRLSEPVRAPIRQFVNHYTTFFEDLIHAVKSELVGRIDQVNNRVDDLDRSVSTSHQALTDQMAMQAATLRTLGAEVERLQAATLDDDLLDLAAGGQPTAAGSTTP